MKRLTKLAGGAPVPLETVRAVGSARTRVRRAACIALVLAAASLAACRGSSWLPSDGGIHREKEEMFIVRGFHSDPIVGRAMFWIGEGGVPNGGGSAQYYRFLDDRVALGAGMSRWEFRPAGKDDVGGWEAEMRLRYYCLEAAGVGLFVDANGGAILTEHPMPPPGTKLNYTFSFGTGLEIPISSKGCLLGGMEFHHMSNARGRYAEDNPAQNQRFYWLGFGIKW